MPDPLIGVFRGIPASDYHSRPGASPSKLRHFHGTTPAHAKLAIDTPVEPTPGMILGTLAHAAALEPDKPLPGIVMVPKEYPETEAVGKPWNNNAKFCRNWHIRKRNAGLIALKETEFQNLQGAIKALIDHEDAGPILRAKGEAEVALGCLTTHGPVRQKYDWLTASPDIYDVKVTTDASERWWSKHAWEMGYHLQVGQGLWLHNEVRRMTAVNDEAGGPATYEEIHDFMSLKTGFLFVVVENTPPHAVNVFRASPEFIRLGTEAFMRHLATFHECNTTGIWPAFTKGIKELEPPGWAL